MKLIHSDQYFANNNSIIFFNRINSLKTSILLTLIMLLNINNAFSMDNNIQSLTEIQETAKLFLEEMQPSADKENREIVIGKIDPRLRFSRCDGTIEAFLPQEARTTGRTTVGVRCLGTVAWKLYISANIQEFQIVWVAQIDISSNDLISANDLKQQRIAVSSLRELPAGDLKMIVNASPIRSIRAGDVIFENNICLVCKGDRVAVLAQNDFMSIQVDGIALSNARLGEITQIKNSKSKRVFGATVTGKRQLSVNLSSTN